MPSLERVNILMVDDRADGLLTMQAVLQSPEYNLISASSGAEALALVHKNEFAVILLDVQMPGMDGFQTAARIKQIPRAQSTPILFITAIHKDPFYIYKGYHLGAVDYIFKPFDPAILKSKVAVFVNSFCQKKHIEQQAIELHQKEQQLHESQKLEAIGRLAGGVAHDFNNLITGIIGLSHDVAATLDEHDQRREDLDEISKAANRALVLTKQLLAFGRRQVISPRVLDMNAVISDMTKMLQRLITENITLDTALSPQLPAVKIDQSQIEQIIMNLVLNARDAMPQGGRIALSTEPVQMGDDTPSKPKDLPAGAYAKIVISDTGCGMERRILDHIFEPYYTTKEKEKGTGLGLATVYGVVMQCRGHISVESAPGKGTTFTVYLPIAWDAAAPEPPPFKDSEKWIQNGTETLLIVEDERIVREVVTRILRKKGYTVLVASDAKEALELSEDYRAYIHMVITDVVMPGMNGRQLAETLLKSRPAIKVLYMSGYSEDIVIHQGIVDPGISFIEKSFTVPQFLAKVRQVLDTIPAQTPLQTVPSQTAPSAA